MNCHLRSSSRTAYLVVTLTRFIRSPPCNWITAHGQITGKDVHAYIAVPLLLLIAPIWDKTVPRLSLIDAVNDIKYGSNNHLRRVFLHYRAMLQGPSQYVRSRFTIILSNSYLIRYYLILNFTCLNS